MTDIINLVNSNFPQNDATGEYFQGWDSIAEEIKNRLSSLSFRPKVHDHLKHIRENSLNTDWVEAFAIQDPNQPQETPLVNAIMLNRNGIPVVKISKDDTRKFTRRSDVEIYVFYGFENFPQWHKNLDEIQRMLGSQDRTFGKRCLTYQIPDSGESLWALFGGVECHHTVLKIRIEEAGALPS